MWPNKTYLDIADTSYSKGKPLEIRRKWGRIRIRDSNTAGRDYLRIDVMEGKYDEAIKVYENLRNIHPASKEAMTAPIRESEVRMIVLREREYNRLRCQDTIDFLKLALTRCRPSDAELLQGFLTEAQRLIENGQITLADGTLLRKCGQQLDSSTALVLNAPPQYVSRGAEKLLGGIAAFHPPMEGAVALDLGASTGGFTDVLLQHGASKVYAVDVGYNQLDWRLRTHPQVVCMERTNIRNVTPEDIGEAVADVSYDADGVRYTREYFTSYPDRAMGMRLAASKKGALDFTIRVEAPFLRPFGQKVGKGRKLRYRVALGRFNEPVHGGEYVSWFNSMMDGTGFMHDARKGRVVDVDGFAELEAENGETAVTFGPTWFIQRYPVRIRGLVDNGCAC